ncbi:MAG: hypothetical protein ACLFRG_03895 [Desulfococcaceae bacterium]
MEEQVGIETTMAPKTEVEISLFGRGSDPPTKGKLLQCESQDFCMLSPEAFPEDAILYLKFSEAMEGPNGLRDETLGRIRWVRYADADDYPYEIGVEQFSFTGIGE